MEILYAALPFAGCAAMTVLCMRMMRGGHRQPTDGDAKDVSRLRAEVEALRAQRGQPVDADAGTSD